MKLHVLHAIAHILSWAWGLATACFGASFWDANWTGLRINVSDPERTICGNNSACPPCNAVVREVLAYTETATKNRPDMPWYVGLGEYSNGRKHHIAIVKAAPGEATPYFESVVNGDVVKKVAGYQGGIQSIIDLYPGPMETTKITTLAQAYPPRFNRAYPINGQLYNRGLLLGHLSSPEHGYPAAYLQSLTTVQLQALHDQDHNNGLPTNRQSWVGAGVRQQPIYAAPPVVYPPTVIYESPPVVYAPPIYATPPAPVRFVAPPASAAPRAGFQYRDGVHLFGMPIMGRYASGSVGASWGNSRCPGGRCPP